MKTSIENKILYGLGVIVLVAIAFLASEATWATNRSDPDVEVDVDQRQDQDQGQEQGQDQEQGQSQSQTSDQANNQALTVNGSDELKTTGRAWVSSGDATADCQKFAGISTGWLGGALGLGVNFTDKDCRALQIYDRLVGQGEVDVANRLLCGTKALRKAYGKGKADVCELALNDAIDGYQANQGAQEAEIDRLRRQVRELSESSRQATPGSPGNGTGYSEYDRQDGETVALERVTDAATCPDCPDCSEEATRAFKQCVAK